MQKYIPLMLVFLFAGGALGWGLFIITFNYLDKVRKNELTILEDLRQQIVEFKKEFQKLK